VILGGTLTLPEATGPHPAVVLITGSGAENRDEEVFGFKVFRLIADHLTRNGIAVLRCDDAGLADLPATWPSHEFRLCRRCPRPGGVPQDPVRDRPVRIGLLGHSEGGLIAPIAATRSADVAFIILVSGPGLPGSEILLAQSETVGRSEGASDETIRKNQDIQRMLFAAARTGSGWTRSRRP